jgi:hypothetical protein
MGLFAYGFVFTEIFDYEIYFFVVSGVNDTAHHWSLTTNTADQGNSKFTVLWLLLKGIPIKKSYTGKLYYTISTTFIQNIRGLTKDHFCGQRCQWHRWPVDFLVEYLCEYEAICKKTLTCGPGAQMELFDEKNQRSKISWQGPFDPLFKDLERFDWWNKRGSKITWHSPFKHM